MSESRITKQLDNKIGFVINPDAKPEEQLLYILTIHKEKSGCWDIMPPCNENDEKKKRSLREYGQALFILLSYAAHQADTKKRKALQQKHNDDEQACPLRISTTDDIYGRWAKKLHTIITTPKQYGAIDPAVRKGLAPLLAAVTGRHFGDKPRIEIAADCLERVFFWNIKKEPFASIDFEENIANKTAIELSPIPFNSFELAEIHIFSQRIRYSISIKTWIDLYCKYTIESTYAPSSRWLKTTAIEVEKDQIELPHPPDVSMHSRLQAHVLKTTDLPLDLEKIMVQYKNVLLTGPAGSGKTTALKLLNTAWMSQDKPLDEQYLCFYLRLKDFEHLLHESVVNEHRINIDDCNIAEWIGLSVIATLGGKCSETELRSCLHKNKNRNQSNINTLDERLRQLKQEITTWFEIQGCHDNKVIVLMDGINELSSELRYALTLKIEDLARQECKCVVACRSNFATTFSSGYSQQIIRFELQELNNSQIIDHLEHNIPGQGKTIFDSQMFAVSRSGTG